MVTGSWTQVRLTVVLAVAGADALLLVFAYLIGVWQMTGLISGYKQGTADDEAGLARMIAIRLCVLAAIYLAFGLAFLLVATSTTVVIWLFGIVVATLGGAIAIETGKARYLRPPVRPDGVQSGKE